MPALRSRIFFAFSGQSLTLESLKANPTVPGVSVITIGPAKGHFKFDQNDQPVPVMIDQTTLDQVMACAATYEGGLRVNAGHFTGVLDAAGYLTGYRMDNPKLRADLALFPTYKEFEHLCNLIVTIPDTFGLSIDFSGPSEIRDGAAFARCTEIYSADLVPVPAANDRGLFGAGYVFCECGKIVNPFDNENEGMTPEQLAQFNKALADFGAATTKFNEATGKIEVALPKIDSALTKISDLETKLAALGTPITDTQLSEVRKIAEAARDGLTEQGTKLASRLGIEFAARAGAKPAGEGKQEEGETRKPFEIPTSERNAEAARALLGKK